PDYFVAPGWPRSRSGVRAVAGPPDAVATVPLGLVERAVGGFDQALGGLVRGRYHGGDAHAEADDAGVGTGMGLGECHHRLADPLADGGAPVLVRALEDDGELLATVPAHQVAARSDAPHQGVGDF